MKHALAAAGWICALASSLALLPPPAQAAAAPPERATPTEGTLFTLDGKRLVDVPLKHTDVRISVSGYVAEVNVVQTFQNPYDHKIEAIYAFPLPTGAAVNRLLLTTGGETIEGKLYRRGEAKAIYKAAKDAGKIAALLEEERANLFTHSVANIEPGAEVRVAIHFVQEVPYDHGTYELVFPMVASPRFIPGDPKAAKGAAAGAAKGAAAAPPAGAGTHADTDRVPDASRVTPLYLPPDTRSTHDITVGVYFTGDLPARDLRSPSHRIVTTRGTGACCSPHALPIGTTGVALDAGDTIPNKDFVLRWELAAEAPLVALFAHKAAEAKEGHFFLRIEPPATGKSVTPAPRELVFVLDTSSSMEGAPLAKAKEVVRKSLRELLPDDTFQIVRFSDRASALGAKPLAASARNVALALEWLDGLGATGGTEMIEGIRAALDFPHDAARLRIVLFLTDGYIGNEDEALAAVHERLGASRLFSFGVGTAVNRYLLEEMAALGRGAVEIARPDEDTAAAVERFHARIARPVLTDVSIDWKGLAVSDLVPAAIPDLFLGTPIAVHGRYLTEGTATVEVHGTLAGKRVSFPIAVVLPAVSHLHPATATVWAKARLRELTRALIRKDDPAIVEAATTLALQHQLLSRWTAFVAVSEKVTKGDPAVTMAVPLEAPEGLAPKMKSTGTVTAGAGAGSAITKSMGAFAGKPPPKAMHDAPEPASAGDEGLAFEESSPRATAAFAGPSAGEAVARSVAVASAGGSGPLKDLKAYKPKSEDRAKVDEKKSVETHARGTYTASMKRCYDDAIGRKVPLGKGVAVELVVGADGKVERAAAAGASDSALDGCIAVAARSWKFEPSKGAATAKAHRTEATVYFSF